MASLSFCPQFQTSLMSNRQVIELLLQLKSAKAHSKNYIKVKPHLVRHLLRNCLLQQKVALIRWTREGENFNCIFEKFCDFVPTILSKFFLPVMPSLNFSFLFTRSR